LSDNGGVDMPLLASSESIVLKLDLGGPSGAAPDGEFDIVVGVPSDFVQGSTVPDACSTLNINCFGIYRPSGGNSLGEVTFNPAADPQFGPGVDGVSYYAKDNNRALSMSAPDVQWTLRHFSELRNAAVSPSMPFPTLTAQDSFSISFRAYAGSFQDDGALCVCCR
jgi:hypothetical protein